MVQQPVSVVSQCGAGACLYGLTIAEIGADLQEAVAHLRRYTNPQFTLLYFASLSVRSLETKRLKIFRPNLVDNY